MTTLLVILGVALLLAVACIRESRSGKPAWGAHLDPNASSLREAAAIAKKGVATTLVIGGLMGIDGGDG